MNFIQIAGHLGGDPEERFTQSGKKVTTFNVACRARKGGQETTIWWRVTVWGDDFKNLMPHLKKGSAVMIHGEVQKPEVYTSRDGKPQVSLDIKAVHIQFSPFGKGNGSSGSEARSGSSFGSNQTSAPSNPYMGYSPDENQMGSSSPAGATFDDEVPF